jgi:prevent-host-death family protein
MVQVNVHEAKSQLSALLARVEQGEEVVVARAGVPVARLVRYEAPTGRRPLGVWKGEAWLADDWDSDETNEEIARDFGI